MPCVSVNAAAVDSCGAAPASKEGGKKPAQSIGPARAIG
jgi:hypothetical protein